MEGKRHDTCRVDHSGKNIGMKDQGVYSIIK